jgi:ubiquinol-cytochrome c reductase cytochrome c1 subunit
MHRLPLFSRQFASMGQAAAKFGLPVLAAGVSAVTIMTTTECDDDSVHPFNYPWSHYGPLSAFDAASIRRGHQVYQQVCASCHGISRIAYRNLVGVCYTEDEVKLFLQDMTVEDGPNAQGEMFERQAKLFDYMQSPYKNEGIARSINNGALPPDLSLIVKARHGYEDYIFSLLTGYCDPPAGVSLRTGLFFHPHFPGGAIAMPPPLIDGAVTYEDGTPATASQMAKDVTTFLAWCAEPEADARKQMGAEFIVAMIATAVVLGYMKRFKWAAIKSRRLEFRRKEGGGGEH